VRTFAHGLERVRNALPKMSNCISTFSVGQINSGKRNIRSRQWAVAGMVSLLMVQMASAVVVEFTTAEGYTSGSLNNKPTGQAMWLTSSGNTSYTVIPTGAGSVLVDTAASSATAVYQTPIDFTTGVAYTSSVEFSFTQAVAKTEENTTLFSNAYSINPAQGTITNSAISIGRVTDIVDGYRFATFGSASVNIAGTALGINSVGLDTTSDVIRMTLTLQQGATAAAWIGIATLYNVTTSTVLATRTVSTLNLGGSVFTDTTLYGTMALGGNSAASGVTDLTVFAYGSPVAVPEPATWALLIGGALFLVLRRARQRA